MVTPSVLLPGESQRHRSLAGVHSVAKSQTQRKQFSTAHKYICKIFFPFLCLICKLFCIHRHVKTNVKFTETWGWKDYTNSQFVTRSWRNCLAISKWAAGFLCSEKSVHSARGRCMSSSVLLKENSIKMWLALVPQWFFHIKRKKRKFRVKKIGAQAYPTAEIPPSHSTESPLMWPVIYRC